MVLDTTLDENSVCGIRNLAFRAFLECRDVGDGIMFLDTRLDESSVCGIMNLGFCVFVKG